ncbi:MAG: radical SAM protein, partial [Nanoarchaeota archaeon]|nr:radical SAM protein [Nanoarchaeota archaeon]
MDNPSIAGVRFIVTSTCNYNCVYCHNEWEPKEKPLTGIEKELIDSIISSAKKLSASEVDLTGGEPLLEIERVKEILLSAKKHGLWTNMTTNGFFLDEYLGELSNLGLKEIHIHIPSLDEKKYRDIMRGNSNLNKVLNAVKIAVKTIEKVMINIPIEKGINDDEIMSFIEYFNKIGATPRFIESMSTSKYIPLKKETIEKIIGDKFGKVEETGEYLWGIKKYRIGNYKFEILRCICFDRKCDICQNTNFIHIDKDYNIRPCNLRKERFKIEPNNSKEILINAFNFLKNQTDIPEEYYKIWE